MNKYTPKQILNIVVDTARKLELNIQVEKFWIRDFEIADNDNPFQYQQLSFEKLVEVVNNLDSMFIRIGIESDSDILYDYYSEMDKTCYGKLIEVQ